MAKDVPHLLTYLSGHGFGHVSQVAPVLNLLREQCPELRLTVCSTAPLAQLQARITGDFLHINEAADFGMVMASALDVLPAESFAEYQQWHSDWPILVRREAEKITALKPDFVLTNVAYLPLAAAQQLGIPCAAMSSLNWADIFAAYCDEMVGSAGTLAQIRAAYEGAGAFLRITPAMPMSDLENAKTVAPIAKVGVNRRDAINAKLGLAKDEKLVLVSMGGMALRFPMERWPQMEGVRWLVQVDWQVSRPDVTSLESLQMEFIDVLASCDVLLCKPGYGSFAEAACNGIPALYVAREDWPEEPILIAWLEEYGLCRKVPRHSLERGSFELELQELMSLPKPMPVKPLGIQQATDYLAVYLDQT
ncbi:MAG: hypothetical protein ACKVN9_01370 [Methylophilaceae bacterium]